MIIICILLSALFICSLIFFLNTINSYKEKLNKHEKTNTRIIQENNTLVQENEKLFAKKTALTFDNEKLTLTNEKLNKSIEDLSKAEETLLNTRKDLTNNAFDAYWETVEQAYKEKEADYQKSYNLMSESYYKAQASLNSQLTKVQEELDKIKATRAAAIQAQVREKEIEQKSSFYCLQMSDSDIADIQKLNNIKKTLNKPRVLSMLIWQTWFQKPLKALAANILGTSTVVGIYKITNTVTKECYIGQSVDVAARWNEHAKCGLGIDTPQGNKLYAAMQEFGLQSFSWELLEQCTRTELDEKERYYIDLYDSVNFGYNSTKGNK